MHNGYAIANGEKKNTNKWQMKQFTEEKPQLDGKDMNNDDMKIV